MSDFPRSPKLLKGGLVLVDPATGMTRAVIALQYNPDTVTRTLQLQAAGGEGQDRSEALRLKGPPVETIKLEAEIDATDQLEFPTLQQNRATVEHGIYPQLTALESMVYPTTQQLRATDAQARAGGFEVAAAEAPLVLFVWSRNRVVPVRPTELSITEEAFDPDLNPLRAKVSLGLRVLSVNDLPFDHPGAGIYMVYQQRKEQLAAVLPATTIDLLGL